MLKLKQLLDEALEVKNPTGLDPYTKETVRLHWRAIENDFCKNRVELKQSMYQSGWFAEYRFDPGDGRKAILISCRGRTKEEAEEKLKTSYASTLIAVRDSVFLPPVDDIPTFP